MKYTTGPWIRKRGPHGEWTDIYHPDLPDCLATTAFHGWTREEREANARRIVACVNACEGINPEAVPDLLAVCRALIDCNTYAHGCIVQAKELAYAAIAKAKGD